MNNVKRTRAFLFILLSGTFLGAITGIAVSGEKVPPGSVVRFGMVYDREGGQIQFVVAAFEARIRELLGTDYELRFDHKISLHDSLTREGAENALRELFADPEVDIVVAAGYAASTAACHMGPLPKPVIAPFALDAELQGLLPESNGGSGIPNLNYLSSPSVVRSHLDVLRQLVSFRKLAIIGHGTMFTTKQAWNENLRTLLDDPDLVLIHVPLAEDMATTLASIPPDVDAVSAVTSTLTDAEVKQLAEGLLARKLPSFTFVGGTDVENGFLAGLKADPKVSRFSRRVALNVQRILQGADPAELPVAFSLEARPVINMATARTLGISPSWSLRLEAELVQDEPPPEARQLALGTVMREAMKVNLDLKAQQEAVASGEQEVKRAGAYRLPQIEIGAQSVWIDEDRAAASFGSTAEQTTFTSASLVQLIYSEKVYANYSIQKHIQTAREQDLVQVQLDVALEAAIAYLDVLRAESAESIQRENLLLTQSNLEMARVRESIGVAGPAEVYRWESEIAQQRNELIQTNSLRNLAEIQLNRVLVRPLEEPFVTESVSLTDRDFLVDGGWLQRNIGDPMSFRRLRMWLVDEALQNSPELQALDAAIAAQGRSLTATNRAYYVPDVTLSGGYDWILDRSGAGSEGAPSDPDLPPGIFPATPDDHDWNIVLALSLPLFEGGARRADQLQARRDLELLRRQHEATAQRVAQRVRSAAHAAGASFANIKNSRDAANAAARSLEVVKDSYARGAANFLDLLEAQNNALVTDVVATNAVFGFLIDYMKTQRAVGRFDLLMTEQQREEVKARRDVYMAGVTVGDPGVDE